MGRAIAALTGQAAAWLPRPLAVIRSLFGGFWQELTRDALRDYRPERHYMRGPGPAWHAKFGHSHGKRPRG
jgi:hypothetical protein